MNIIIFGAAGNVGSRIVNEALSRGHRVSAVVRTAQQLDQLPNQVQGLVSAIQEPEQVRELIAGHDLIISAVRPPSGAEQHLVAITEVILNAANQEEVRALIVGGAASLIIPHLAQTVLAAKGFLPAEIVPIATACFAQHKAVEVSAHQNWAYLSPPAMLVPGERTGDYQIGKNELLYDGQGNSRISMEDFAVALLDEAQEPRHHQQRFTVAYQ